MKSRKNVNRSLLPINSRVTRLRKIYLRPSQSPFTRKRSKFNRRISKNRANRYNKSINNLSSMSPPKHSKLILLLSYTVKN